MVNPEAGVGVAPGEGVRAGAGEAPSPFTAAHTCSIDGEPPLLVGNRNRWWSSSLSPGGRRAGRWRPHDGRGRAPGVAGVGQTRRRRAGRLGGGAMHGADAGLVMRGARSPREAGERAWPVSESASPRCGGRRVARVRRIKRVRRVRGVRAHLARRRVGCLLWAVPRGSVAVEHVVEIHVVEAPRAPVLRARGSNICATHGAICYRQPPRRVVVRARLAARGEGRRRSEGTLRTFARALVMSSARAETPLAMNAAGQARPPRPTDATRENFGRSSRRRKIPSGRSSGIAESAFLIRPFPFQNGVPAIDRNQFDARFPFRFHLVPVSPSVSTGRDVARVLRSPSRPSPSPATPSHA